MTTSHETNEDQPRAYTPEEVQDEFFGHAAFMVPYWVNTNHYAYKDSPLKEKLSGILHSFYATTSGSSGGFGCSVEMLVYGTEEAAERNIKAGRNFFPIGWEGAVDINDHGLKYHDAENHVPVPESAEDEGSREWTEEEMRVFFFNRVADFIAEWDSKTDISDMDKAAGMMRDIFVLCEGRDPKFEAKVALVATPHPEDKEYHIENGENFYEEETNLRTDKRDLVEAWDFWWSNANASLTK